MNFPEKWYLDGRLGGAAASGLRESKSKGGPPERWLQEIWAHQRIRRDALSTTEGRRLSILHPGFWNREAGPDFLRAVIQIDDQPPVSGDIEIDLHPGGWKSHGHATNKAFGNVILHVVWEASEAPPVLPTLRLQSVLDAPLEELETWVGGAGEVPSKWLEGDCCAPLHRLPPQALREVLRQAARVRLRTKAYLFRARARVVGWHQALWEGVFRALGYKHNAWPMQAVAELLPEALTHPVETPEPREGWEARLLGLSGLLPAEPKPGTRARRLWDFWWRERELFQPRAIPAALWRLNGVRPANHPQRRLALAAAWVADPGWIGRLEEWFRTLGATTDTAAAEHALFECLRPEPHGFWRRHYTLTTRELPEAPALLGAGRINDLAVNVILPWFWARAEVGREPATQEMVTALYDTWSPGEDNTTLKLARARLLGTDSLPGPKTAALQQGMLQIVRDFCSYSNAVCENCRFPELVAGLKVADPAAPD